MAVATWAPGSKAYAAGAGEGLAEPVRDFIINLGIWLGGDETWLRPLGTVVAIGIGFILAYVAPQQQQLLRDQDVLVTKDHPNA